MKDSFKDRILNVITLVILVLIVVGGSALAYPNWKRGRILRERESELRAQIDRRQLQIDEIKENQRRFKTDPDFVEMIARRHQRVYPGEIIFMFED